MNTYLAERDMTVRLGDNRREVERRRLRRIARGASGFAPRDVLNAFTDGLSQSLKLAKDTTEGLRTWYAGLQTSQPQCQ